MFQYGCELGIPFLAALHDNSKFMPEEFLAYAEFFYGETANTEEKARVNADFNTAWLIHQKRNKHHWQFWLLVNDEEPMAALPMPDRYRKEMLADWKGAGKAINGVEDALGWYTANRSKITLHVDTRLWIEQMLGYHG